VQLQLNHEGEQYIIGIPLKDKPGIFMQQIIEASLLDWVPTNEGNIASFATMEQARRAINDLTSNGFFREGVHPVIYKVAISCLSEGNEGKNEEVIKSDSEQRLLRAVANEPERWLPEYDKEHNLVSVADRDTGRLWVRSKEGWCWVD